MQARLPGVAAEAQREVAHSDQPPVQVDDPRTATGSTRARRTAAGRHLAYAVERRGVLLAPDEEAEQLHRALGGGGFGLRGARLRGAGGAAFSAAAG